MLLLKELNNELAPLERLFFKMLFTGKLYRKIFRLYELESIDFKLLMTKHKG